MFEFKVTAASIPELMEKIAALSALGLAKPGDVEVPLPEPRGAFTGSLEPREAAPEPGEPQNPKESVAAKRAARKAAAEPQGAAQDGGLGALELGTVRPTTQGAATGTETAPTAEAEPDTQASAEPASEPSAEAGADSSPSLPADAAAPEVEAEVVQSDLPQELDTFIDALEKVESWTETKTALQAFLTSDFFKGLPLDQANRMRRNAWETLLERGVDWVPNHMTDVSAFRLWLEAQDDPNVLRDAWDRLQADDAFQSRPDGLRANIAGAVAGALAELEG